MAAKAKKSKKTNKVAKRQKTLFISDIHMGPNKDWDWFSIKQEGPNLVKFFEYVSKRYVNRGDIKELVLLGDVFDLWVCPYDEMPHTFDDILAVQGEIIKAVKKVPSEMPILYVNGNHDYQVTRDDIARAFSGRVNHIGDVYRRRNIWAEHGHRHALFNRPDMKNGGYLRLPLGYYITRLHTSLRSHRKDRINLVMHIIDELFQTLGPEQLPESVLDAFKRAVEKASEDGKKVEKFTMGHICDDQEYDDVRDRYRNLFEDWKHSGGFWEAVQMIMCELNRLGTVADQQCRNGVDIVVFGHSHSTKMDKDSWLVKNRIYANCGYWCGLDDAEKNGKAHFVETDGESVTLCSFTDGEAEVVKPLRL